MKDNIYCVKCRCMRECDATVKPITWTDKKTGEERSRNGLDAVCTTCGTSMKKFISAAEAAERTKKVEEEKEKEKTSVN